MSVLRFSSRLALACVVAAAVAVVGAGQVHAASLTVTNLSDSGGGSLRQAILDANAMAGADTITFSVTGTITLGSTLPSISDELTIGGPGTNSLTISGDHSYRVLEIGSGVTASIAGVTIADGQASEGAAIYNTGTLDLADTAVKAGTARPGPSNGEVLSPTGAA